jgi:phosphoserine phosphatase
VTPKQLEERPAAVPGAQQQVQDMQVILDVSRAMAAAMVLDDLLVLILSSARRILNADRATLFMYDADRHELYSRFTHDTHEIRFSADLGIAGAVAKARRPLNIPDAYADPRFNREIDRQTGYRTRCLLTIPLIGLDEQLVGVMQLVNKNEGVFTEYDEQLGGALAAQVAVAIQRSQLMDHYVQKKELERSLAIARDIQQRLLPKSLPQVPGYDIGGWSRPADETGGDCFDFIPLSDNRLAITLADVTGHGIGPALIMAETRALLRAFTENAEKPSAMLERANRWLSADLGEGRFVTTFFGILDPVHHELEYASAGHGPLFWYQAARRQVEATSSTGLPLGLMDPLIISSAPTVVFAPGDMGILLTDGFIEAQNAAGEFFGQERLIDLIIRKAHLPAAELIQTLAQAVDEFIRGGPQLDDLTAVIIKRQA